jgi:hypothetical protein
MTSDVIYVWKIPPNLQLLKWSVLVDLGIPFFRGTHLGSSHKPGLWWAQLDMDGSGNGRYKYPPWWAALSDVFAAMQSYAPRLARGKGSMCKKCQWPIPRNQEYQIHIYTLYHTILRTYVRPTPTYLRTYRHTYIHMYVPKLSLTIWNRAAGIRTSCSRPPL